jgi:hypothetical protein
MTQIQHDQGAIMAEGLEDATEPTALATGSTLPQTQLGENVTADLEEGRQ